MIDLGRILETLPVGVWVGKVPTGDVAYVNPEFGKIMGMGAVEGAPIGEAPAVYGIFDLQGRPYPVEGLPFSRVLATGREVTIDDIVIHRPDNRRVNIRAFAYPILDTGGMPTHVVVAFLDITQEVKAKVERAQTESRLALAVHHAPIVIWSADAKGVVTLSEGAGLESMGVQSGQLVGKNLFELYENHPSVPGYLRRGLAGESFWYTVEVGEAVYDTWLTPIRDAGGSVTGIAGLSKDVTEIRTLQSSAIQNDRAIALGTLAASVAHEINNPLTYMLGHLGFLQETLERLDQIVARVPEPQAGGLRAISAEFRKSLDPVAGGTERIAGITSELRTFSRPVVGEGVRVDVSAVVGTVLKLVGKELQARARLEVELHATLPVRGLASRLVQVVLNLVVNAMQALAQDWPGANRIWIRTRDEGDSVVIEVADTGPGVPPQDRDRIFEPFMTTKDVGVGTGLGLFVCRNIVRGMSGSVTVEDRPGGGALFRVVLPAARDLDVPGAAVVPEATAPAAPRSGRLLIIDDEVAVAEVLRAQLQAAGYDVTLETDPRKALEILTSDGEGIDLVYCDLMMKEMNGMDLADALAARAPSQRAKMVFMTGGAFTPRARAFSERHVSQCVDKPFDVVGETERRLRPRPPG